MNRLSKVLLSIGLLALSLGAGASAPKLTVEQNLVVSYFRCFEVEKELPKIERCTSKIVTADLPKVERARMNTWLLRYRFKLAGFTKCDSKRVAGARFFSLASQDYICAELRLGTVVKPAIFYLDKKRGSKVLLKSIYY